MFETEDLRYSYNLWVYVTIDTLYNSTSIGITTLCEFHRKSFLKSKMSQPNIFNGDEQQIRAVFDLCKPNTDGLISLRTFQQLYEEHTSKPGELIQSSDSLVSYVLIEF